MRKKKVEGGRTESKTSKPASGGGGEGGRTYSGCKRRWWIGKAWKTRKMRRKK